jgi:ribosomal protein S27AE
MTSPGTFSTRRRRPWRWRSEVDRQAPTVGYGSSDSENGVALFLRVCPKCSRFVKADADIAVNGLGLVVLGANAMCSRCGRVEMPFFGFV